MSRYDGPIDPFFPHGRPSGSASSSRAMPERRTTAPAREPAAPAAAQVRPAMRPVAEPRTARRRSPLGRLVVPLVIAGLVAGGITLYERLRVGTLHVLNGFDVPLDVVLEDTAGEAPHARGSARGRWAAPIAGAVTLQAFGPNGEPVVEDTFEVPRGLDLTAYNILGAAAVQLEEVVYSASPSPSALPHILPFWGHTLIARDGVQHLFEPAPETVSIPSRQRQVSRWVFDYVGDGSWIVTVEALLSSTGAPARRHREQAAEIVGVMRRLDPSNPVAQGFEARLTGGSLPPVERPEGGAGSRPPGGPGGAPGVVGPGTRRTGPGPPPGSKSAR
jgi:hypothetical protein